MRALIRAVQEAGGIPVVGDSPGVSSTVQTAEKCGIAAVCYEEKAQIVPFEGILEVPLPTGRTLKRFEVAKVLSEVDKVISAAKMKTHSFMGITGAIKNLFGFIVGTSKAQFHLRMQHRHDFAGMLVDLAAVIKPVLFIVDGVTAMEGNGPRNGSIKQAGVMLAGTNGFAVDLVMASIMGFQAEELPVAARALAAGLVSPLSAIEVIGDGKDIKLNFLPPKNLESLDKRLPPWLVRLGQAHLTARPQIAAHCVGCGRCAQHCPPQAIAIVSRKANIDYSKCIRCYCCQELCPRDAVTLYEGMLLKAVNYVRTRS